MKILYDNFEVHLVAEYKGGYNERNFEEIIEENAELDENEIVRGYIIFGHIPEGGIKAVSEYFKTKNEAEELQEFLNAL